MTPSKNILGDELLNTFCPRTLPSSQTKDPFADEPDYRDKKRKFKWRAYDYNFGTLIVSMANTQMLQDIDDLIRKGTSSKHFSP